MGNWKITTPESIPKDEVLKNITESLRRQVSSGVPRSGVPVDIVSYELQHRLKEAIRTGYEPNENGQPSEDDINAVYDLVSKYLAAYQWIQSQQENVHQWIGNNFPEDESRDVSGILSQRGPIDEAIATLLKNKRQTRTADFHRQQESEARQVFASLLNTTSEDNIKIFGNALSKMSYKARNNALQVLQNLQDKGTFDASLVLGFRKVLKSDYEVGLFDRYFGKVDITTFAAGAGKAKLDTKILEALADANNVRDLLYRSLH
ncbi:hypothetical protein IFM46972_10835 [Aspergillus udagawae]|uniref:Uncharacterized protein n=1 Tax=Aspergillus udagawae TaxID=91492 RepID=A0A8H3XQ88_9EURO|nr:hypothetical protein IFM46972_10835 [Aspergillus udagawae]